MNACQQQPLVYSCSGCSSAAQHADFDPVQAQRVFRAVAQQMARALPVRAEHESALMRPRIAEGACP